jgi:YfiH family protein
MSFNNYKTLKYFTFSSIGPGVRHGIFSRHGGVSPSPWSSLNMGGTVGDDDLKVRNNRQAGFDALNLDISSLFDVWQVHGTYVVYANKPRSLDQPYQKADIILTDKTGVTLMMRFADCTPIILHDPIRKVIGLVHSGWKGTVNQAASKAIEAMISGYGCDPRHIFAGIGPSIGPDHYEVGDDVVSSARKTFGEESPVLQRKANERIHFDLWAANRILLERSGVKEIEIARTCTVCHLEDWYSHRGEKGITGRFGAMISLEA